MGPRVDTTGLAVAADLALCTQSGPWTWLRDRQRLSARLKSLDVVHTHFSHDHTLAALARGRNRRPVLVRTVHSERSLRARLGRGEVLVDFFQYMHFSPRPDTTRNTAAADSSQFEPLNLIDLLNTGAAAPDAGVNADAPEAEPPKAPK